MPIDFHEALHEPGEWGLYHITEPESELRARVTLFPEEEQQIALIKGEGRRREYLAARLLLHHMSGREDRAELYKDPSGKPHLRDSHFHVSISHTVDYSAAIAHPNPCGIDVQRIVPQIERISHKFVSGAEEIQIKEAHRLVQLHLIWSAKEAMYKAFGRRKLDFKAHMYVDFNDFHPTQVTGTSMLRKDGVEMLFDLDFKIFSEMVLVACVERVSDI